MLREMERLPKYEVIRILRDEFGLSWSQIAEVVEGKKDSKTILKMYGCYRKRKDRIHSVSDERFIVDQHFIASNAKYYEKSKVYGSHSVEIVRDLQREQMELAKMLKYVDGEKREEKEQKAES